MTFSEQFSQWLESYKSALARGLDRGAASDYADRLAPIPARVRAVPPRNVYDSEGEYQIPTVRYHWTSYDYNSSR